MPTVVSAMDAHVKEAIVHAIACDSSCLESLNYCIRKGGKHADAPHLGLLIDCARICGISTDYMLRESPFHREVCGICADVCERCAQSCSRFKDDDQMKDCAEKCKICAVSCRRMASMKKAA